MIEAISRVPKDRWFHLKQICFWLLIGITANAIVWFLVHLGEPPIAALRLISFNETNRTVLLSDGGSHQARLGGEIKRWVIMWGDGQSNSFFNAPQSELHHYDQDGEFRISLICVDGSGATSTPAVKNTSLRYVTALERNAEKLEAEASKDSRAVTKAKEAMSSAVRTRDQALAAFTKALGRFGNEPELLTITDIDQQARKASLDKDAAQVNYSRKLKEASGLFLTKARKQVLEKEVAIAREQVKDSSRKLEILRDVAGTKANAEKAEATVRDAEHNVQQALARESESGNAAKTAKEAAQNAHEIARAPIVDKGFITRPPSSIRKTAR